MAQDAAYDFASGVMTAGAVAPDGQEGIAAFVEKRRPEFDPVAEPTTMSGWQLAQFNVATAKFDDDDPRLAEFIDNLTGSTGWATSRPDRCGGSRARPAAPST